MKSFGVHGVIHTLIGQINSNQGGWVDRKSIKRDQLSFRVTLQFPFFETHFHFELAKFD